MTVPNLLQYAAFLLIVVLLVKPVGHYLALVFGNGKTLLDPVLRPIETALYRLFGVRPEEEMHWATYAGAFITFSFVGTLLLYGILRAQDLLPGGPDSKYLPTPMTPDLAMNTAINADPVPTATSGGRMVGRAAPIFIWTAPKMDCRHSHPSRNGSRV